MRGYLNLSSKTSYNKTNLKLLFSKSDQMSEISPGRQVKCIIYFNFDWCLTPYKEYFISTRLGHHYGDRKADGAKIC